MIEAAGEQVRALLLEPFIEPLFAPLAGEMGEFGDLVAQMCAQSIAARL